MKQYTIFTDGGARGNPGPAALGVAIYDDNKKLFLKYGEYLQKQTNNYAEYMAVISALKTAKQHGITNIIFKSDSKLVVEQMNGNWKVKEAHLKLLWQEAQILLHHFSHVTFQYIPREQNKEADAEVNRILDTHTVS